MKYMLVWSSCLQLCCGGDKSSPPQSLTASSRCRDGWRTKQVAKTSAFIDHHLECVYPDAVILTL